MGKIGLNQCIIYINPFHHSHLIFYLPLLNSMATKIILQYKKYWGGGSFALFPPSNYSYVQKHN